MKQIGDDPLTCWVCGTPVGSFDEFCPTHTQIAQQNPLLNPYISARRTAGLRTDVADEAMWRVMKDIEGQYRLSL
jgi:hypothetical protein